MALSRRQVLAESRPVDRRGLLLTGLCLTGSLGWSVLTGCTLSDPRIDSDGRSPRPTPVPNTPPPLAGAREAATGERELFDRAGAILTGPYRDTLPASQRHLLVIIREAHRQHVLALASPDPTNPEPTNPEPTSRPTTVSTPSMPVPQPAPTASARLSLALSLRLLSEKERAQAARLRVSALGATGLHALLWGSMAVAASSFATALDAKSSVPDPPAARARRPMAVVSDIEAIQEMVRQLHAIIYGYQLALGQLSEANPSGKRALAGLQAHRALRDRLEQLLVNRSAQVPVAEPAYVPPIPLVSATSSAELIRRMETALTPFCGLWLASATRSADRVMAFDALARTAATARSWGAPLAVWPGWQD